mmetsp:Transcript_28542/g.71525  ORF Transcript_28542/g.71525 Transcript_28542/m.71525 type:complete len:546 (-) Transcript_28542:208-1845(-)
MAIVAAEAALGLQSRHQPARRQPRRSPCLSRRLGADGSTTNLPGTLWLSRMAAPQAAYSRRVLNRAEGEERCGERAVAVKPPAEDDSSSLVQRAAGKRGQGPKIMGMDTSPELVAIGMVYLVQGILGLSRLAVSFYMKDDLGLDPATTTMLAGVGAFPWLIKPLYGFLSDTVPLFGYRRRSYLLVCGLISASSWLALATVVDSTPGLLIALIAGSFGTACSDVVVDSIVVERARGQPQATSGNLQSLCWGSAAFGGILSSYFSGSLVETYGTHWVFGVTALFPLIVSASALLITEERVQRSNPRDDMVRSTAGGVLASVKAQVTPVYQAFTKKELLLPAIFVFMWQATPSAGSAMFYFQTNYLHFSPEFLGRVQLVGSIASLGGVALYKTLLKDVPLKKMFLWTTLLSASLGLTDLILITGLNREWGLDDHLFVLGDSLLLTVLGQVSFMPILVLATQLCPEGVEATLYAALMSLLNGGSFTGTALGSALTKAFGVTSDDFTNLAPLVTVCCLSCLIPLPFLSLLPPSRPSDSAAPPVREKDEKV